MRKYWTEAERDELRELYPDTPTEDIARHFGVKVHSVHQQAQRLGLKKSAAFTADMLGRLASNMQSHGAAHRFRPGHVTWNKGARGLQIGGEATRFKPGQMPHNTVPVGTIVKDSDGYMKIKIAEPKTWRRLHHKIWEEANGLVPPGMVLVFRDDNPENCELENLELVSRRALMARNTIHNYPAAIKEVVYARIRLIRKINRRSDRESTTDDRNT